MKKVVALCVGFAMLGILLILWVPATQAAEANKQAATSAVESQPPAASINEAIAGEMLLFGFKSNDWAFFNLIASVAGFSISISAGARLVKSKGKNQRKRTILMNILTVLLGIMMMGVFAILDGLGSRMVLANSATPVYFAVLFVEVSIFILAKRKVEEKRKHVQ